MSNRECCPICNDGLMSTDDKPMCTSCGYPEGKQLLMRKSFTTIDDAFSQATNNMSARKVVGYEERVSSANLHVKAEAESRLRADNKDRELIARLKNNIIVKQLTKDDVYPERRR